MAISTKNRAKNSTDQRLSRYVQGGVTDRYNKRLGWWERSLFETSNDDITYVIPQSRDRRPDLVAKDAYGQVSLMWLVLQYNYIVDIETEFRAGKEIKLPTQQRVLSQFMTQAIGGNPITR